MNTPIATIVVIIIRIVRLETSTTITLRVTFCVVNCRRKLEPCK